MLAQTAITFCPNSAYDQTRHCRYCRYTVTTTVATPHAPAGARGVRTDPTRIAPRIVGGYSRLAALGVPPVDAQDANFRCFSCTCAVPYIGPSVSRACALLSLDLFEATKERLFVLDEPAQWGNDWTTIRFCVPLDTTQILQLCMSAVVPLAIMAECPELMTFNATAFRWRFWCWPRGDHDWRGNACGSTNRDRTGWGSGHDRPRLRRPRPRAGGAHDLLRGWGRAWLGMTEEGTHCTDAERCLELLPDRSARHLRALPPLGDCSVRLGAALLVSVEHMA